MLRMSPAEEGPRLRVFNLHPVSARDGLADTILAPACRLRSGDLCEAVTPPYEVVEHTHDVVGTGGAFFGDPCKREGDRGRSRGTGVDLAVDGGRNELSGISVEHEC
jgi:hypothetical protein